jgi:hypothetical protein
MYKSKLKEIITKQLAEYDNKKGWLKNPLPLVGFQIYSDQEDIQKLRNFNNKLEVKENDTSYLSIAELTDLVKIVVDLKTVDGHASYSVFQELKKQNKIFSHAKSLLDIITVLPAYDLSIRYAEMMEKMNYSRSIADLLKCLEKNKLLNAENIKKVFSNASRAYNIEVTLFVLKGYPHTPEEMQSMFEVLNTTPNDIANTLLNYKLLLEKDVKNPASFFKRIYMAGSPAFEVDIILDETARQAKKNSFSLFHHPVANSPTTVHSDEVQRAAVNLS